jgi:hypothetical protein
MKWISRNGFLFTAQYGWEERMMKNAKLWVMSVVFCSFFGVGANSVYAQVEVPKLENCHLDCAAILGECGIGANARIGYCMQECNLEANPDLCRQECLRLAGVRQTKCVLEHQECIALCNGKVVGK